MTGKIRVHELAKELGKDNKEIINILLEKGIRVKSHMSTIEDKNVEMIKNEVEKKEGAAEAPKKKNITQVFRPQNSRGGVGRQGARPQGQNGQGNRGQGTRSQNPQSGRTQQGGRVQGQSVQGNRTASDQQGRNNTDPSARMQGSRPQGDRDQSGRFQGDRDGGRMQGNRPQGDRDGSRMQGGRPQGGRFQGDRDGARMQGSRPQGDRDGGRMQGGRPQGDRDGSRMQGSRPQGDRDQSGRFQGDRDGGRMQGGRPQSGRSISIPKAPVVEDRPITKESRMKNDRDKRYDKEKERDRDRENEKGFGRSGSGRSNPKNSQRNTTRMSQKPNKPAMQPQAEKEETIKTIVLPETMTIKELADKMKIQPSAIVKKLFLQGVMVTVNQEIDYEKAEEIALDFNCIAEPEEKVNVLEELLKDEEDDESTLIARPPVICVMGHVDHGKTSLLDAIRNTHVIDKEAGGITQHIGAYVVSVDGQKITFLDTPGHEAFTAMRMRGANSTDIAILVVAADDGVMPQTVEAINHAKAAGIEIIVAVNKIDKPSANVERVKQELSEYGLIPEDWGGSTVYVPVSAKTQEGIDQLLEMILLTAEVSELKANPKRRARGLVIEAQLDKGKGPVATVLVQKGTLHIGDPIAAGSCYGKVRAMMDHNGRRLKEAGPSTPVEILGLSDVPNAGEIFVSPENEKEARNFAETFISEGREKMLEETKSKMSLDDLFSQIQAGNLKELNIIVKADVQGSVEAVKQSLLKLSNEEVVVKIIHGGVGAITESDVSLASASNAIIIGFNVRPDAMAKATAEREGVDVRLYRVIYDAIADVEAAMKGMLEPIYEEKVIGHAEVRQIFKASGIGNIAGSYVLDGVIQRGSKVRITREKNLIFEGALASLKRGKDDVKEVRSGFECGMVFEKFNDIQEFDQVEAYIMVEVPR
ncbi:MAG: translation initiation factor IF-2 [Lachnospiraceae bacterium]|nr:translation initiation factor IF-2 [Robinsoniella sp.]MDY3765858.1 translation initiation factor IF-2 [Lachnospiraceae bacterium]